MHFPGTMCITVCYLSIAAQLYVCISPCDAFWFVIYIWFSYFYLYESDFLSPRWKSMQISFIIFVIWYICFKDWGLILKDMSGLNVKLKSQAVRLMVLQNSYYVHICSLWVKTGCYGSHIWISSSNSIFILFASRVLQTLWFRTDLTSCFSPFLLSHKRALEL